MSMRVDDGIPTGDRGYRRRQQEFIRQRREQLRRQRQASDRDGKANAVNIYDDDESPPAAGIDDTKNANPWTRKYARQLWMDLVQQASQGRITFTLPQFIKALDRGGPVLRARFGLPYPTLGVQSQTQGSENKDYVIKLYALIGDRPFGVDQLISYLTKPGLYNPLSRVLETRSAMLPSLAKLRL
jgi:hypothetical protein